MMCAWKHVINNFTPDSAKSLTDKFEFFPKFTNWIDKPAVSPDQQEFHIHRPFSGIASSSWKERQRKDKHMDKV